MIGIDRIPSRLHFAESKSGIETIDFSQYSDVTKRIYELCPKGLDVALDCGERPHSTKNNFPFDFHNFSVFCQSIHSDMLIPRYRHVP